MFVSFCIQAFGVGAFEEADDNIYAVDHMSNYDIELGADTATGLHGWTGPPKENARGQSVKALRLLSQLKFSKLKIVHPMYRAFIDGHNL